MSQDPAPDGERDFERLRDLGGLFLRAPRRHRALAIACFVLPAILGVVAAMYWPRSYGCDVRILAQRSLVLPALGNPGRVVPREADSPTQSAADSILRRDGIVAMIKELDLLDRAAATRQPALRWKDRVWSVLHLAPDGDRLRDMEELLDRRLEVRADESSITIAVEWPDRELSFEIVTFLQKNFLEARYDSSVSVISEAIRILETRERLQSDEVGKTLAQLTNLEDEQRSEALSAASPARPPVPVWVRRGPPPAGAPSTTARPADGGNAATELTDVTRRIALLEEDHDRQLIDARNQLSDARATLGPLHPTVMGLMQKIDQLGREPPQSRALQARERELSGQLALLPKPAHGAARAGLWAAAAPVATAPAPLDLDDTPEITLARSKLRDSSAKLGDMLSRIEAANIELDVTRAAFKYQYTVVRPAELPRGPLKPNAPLLLLSFLLAAALLTLLGPGLLDLWRGRLIEAWQVKELLDLPLLGQLDELGPRTLARHSQRIRPA